MDDLISRQAAMTMPVLPKEHRDFISFELDDIYEQGWNECQKFIAELPSADRPQGWIPCSERLPEPEKYVLLSFDNFTLSEVGRYEVDDDGGGAFYAGDDEKSYSSYGIFVNAWMPLPEPWKGADDE